MFFMLGLCFVGELCIITWSIVEKICDLKCKLFEPFADVSEIKTHLAVFARYRHKFCSIPAFGHIFSHLDAASLTRILKSTDAFLVLQSCVIDAGYHDIMAAS